MLKKLKVLNTGIHVSFAQMNIVDHASIERAVKNIVSIAGHVDVLINGVGALADKDVETTIAVNLVSLVEEKY